jgi:hypothetical protein
MGKHHHPTVCKVDGFVPMTALILEGDEKRRGSGRDPGGQRAQVASCADEAYLQFILIADTTTRHGIHEALSTV